MSSVTSPTFSRHDEPLAAAVLGAAPVGLVLLGLVVFVNEAVLRYSDVERFGFDFQIGMRLAVCALCGLYGWLRLPRTSVLLERFPLAWAVLFAGWALATVPTGINPSYSFAAVAALACILLFAPAVLLDYSPRQIITAIVIALVLFMFGSWIMYYVNPTVGVMEDVAPDGTVTLRMGGMGHPNGLGRQAALLIALLLVLHYEHGLRWRTAVPVLALAAWTLYCTDSRTALVAAVAAAGLVVARQLSGATLRWLLLAAAATIVAGGAMLWSASGDALLDQALGAVSRSGESEEVVTLTGRTDLWEFAVQKIREKPFLGHGYGAARFVTVDGHFATHHAHNLLLNVMLGSGVIGGAILLAMLLGQMRRAWFQPATFPDVITVLVCVGGLADYVMLNPIPDSHTALWFMALAWRQPQVIAMSSDDDNDGPLDDDSSSSNVVTPPAAGFAGLDFSGFDFEGKESAR